MEKPKKLDKYNIKDANYCVRCDDVKVMPKGYGRKWYLCQKCFIELKKMRKHWEKYGLFIGVKK